MEGAMVNKISDEQVVKNAQIVEKLIETFPSGGTVGGGRRELVQSMFKGIVGQEFYAAPASPRESWHNCFPGGLCDHSLRVVSNLMKISKSLAPDRYSPQTLTFVGLFHDLGKVGDGERPYYLPLEGKDNSWRRQKGELYEINKDCTYMPTSERGLYILQKYGIELSADEYLAIRLNDGMYEEANKRYALHEPDLALLVHFADRYALQIEKTS
jgi:hypothetical protein